ncbi:ParB/RepB/Spo0J family partition protein [Streptomyces sp. NBC_00335]|uniref:ParB/RepB/Spo0J family partition protein n=1 Tax=unclassified Streptomyces TaxID=2593676 RepID=UPI0022518980|nr:MULTISPECIES: ParB/RepB/Spo0J family partition protein [unclassified Streptomyces]MCX5406613.1 ParB/RepB/Spo0J family partition protein [Streptomyces sp. NBC_00086]
MFPMLNEEEMHDLAQSIKNEGLLKPIVLDPDGVLLDGRNRLAACEIAGVEPHFTTYDGNDPIRLIFSANAVRRHLSQGQRSMILAMARSFSEHSLRTHAKLHAISLTRLSNATTVLQYSPDLAEQVRIGSIRLDAAYDIARQHKARRAVDKSRHELLCQHAPDLAEQVSEGLLTLDEAIASLDRRLKEERIHRRVEEIDNIRQADGDTAPSLTQRAEQGELTWVEAHQLAEQHHVQRQDAIQRAQQVLEQLATDWAAVQSLATHLDTPYAREVLAGLTPAARGVAARLTFTA